MERTSIVHVGSPNSVAGQFLNEPERYKISAITDTIYAVALGTMRFRRRYQVLYRVKDTKYPDMSRIIVRHGAKYAELAFELGHKYYKTLEEANASILSLPSVHAEGAFQIFYLLPYAKERSKIYPKGAKILVGSDAHAYYHEDQWLKNPKARLEYLCQLPDPQFEAIVRQKLSDTFHFDKRLFAEMKSKEGIFALAKALQTKTQNISQ